jgi:hypothetical protein
MSSDRHKKKPVTGQKKKTYSTTDNFFGVAIFTFYDLVQHNEYSSSIYGKKIKLFFLTISIAVKIMCEVYVIQNT